MNATNNDKGIDGHSNSERQIERCTSPYVTALQKDIGQLTQEPYELQRAAESARKAFQETSNDVAFQKLLRSQLAAQVRTLELKLHAGDRVTYRRPAKTKDESVWHGPAEVLAISTLSDQAFLNANEKLGLNHGGILVCAAFEDIFQ